MAMYTIGILDKLLANANGADLTDPAQLLPVAKATLFGTELNVISEEYRDRFALGFAQEFINDEIGLETWTGFRMALAHRIYDSAEYINTLFENLDKEVFSHYNVTQTVGNSTTNGTTSGTSTGTTTDKGNVENTGTSSETTASTGSDTTTSSSKHTGSDSTANTGTTKNEATDTGTSSDESSTTTSYDGDISTVTTGTNTGKQYTAQSVTQQTDGTTGHDSDLTTSQTSKNDDTSNGWSGSSDIPENGITDPSTLTDKDNLTYLSAAGLSHSTSTANGTTTQKVNGTADKNKDTVNQTVTTTADRDNNYREDNLSTQQTQKVTNPDQTVASTSSSNTSNTNRSTLTLDTEATTTYGGITDETGKTEHKTDATRTGTTGGTTKTTSEGTTSTTTGGTHKEDSTNSVKTESYEMSYDMIVKSRPYLKKIWRLFDDLFFLILN